MCIGDSNTIKVSNYFFNLDPRICLEREKNISRLPPLHTLIRVEPVTFCCTGRHFNQLSHLARAILLKF